MAFPIAVCTNGCCGKIPYPNDRDPQKAMCGKGSCVGLTIFDALAAITCVVIGILGALNLIAMSVAAAYALIGISCGITLLWIALAVAFCIAGCKKTPNQL